MTIRPKNIALAGATFLIGLLTQSSVNVIGNMPLAEFVTLGILAVLIVRAALEGRAAAELFRTPLFWIVVVAQLIPYWSPRPLSAAAVHEEPFHVEYLPELVTRTQYVVVGQETLRMSSPGTSVVSGDQVLPL